MPILAKTTVSRLARLGQRSVTPVENDASGAGAVEIGPRLPGRRARGGATIRHGLRAFAKDERAAAAVEFSLVALPLLGLLLAALQLSVIFFAEQVLQSAATDAGRELMTGQA